MNYFKFEIRRILFSRKNKLLFIILIFLLFVLAFYSSSLKLSNNIKSLEVFVDTNISYTNQSLKKFNYEDNSDVPKEIVAGIIKENETRLKLYNDQKMAIQKKDLTQFHRIQLKINQLEIENSKGQDIIYLKDENAYINDVLAKKLEFENYPQAQLRSFGIIHEVLFPLLFSSLFYIIIMLISGLSLATDFENNHMKLYKTPVFREKNIVLTTFTANVTVVGIWYILAVAVYIISVGLMNGFGALNYPSAIPGLNLMENGKIDLLYLLWGFLMIIFVTAFGTWISLILKRSSVVVALFAILVLGYDMIKNQEFMKDFLQFLPMTYLEPLSLLKGAEYLPRQAVIVGVLYLLILSAIFLVLASISYKKLRFRKLQS